MSIFMLYHEMEVTDLFYIRLPYNVSSDSFMLCKTFGEGNHFLNRQKQISRLKVFLCIAQVFNDFSQILIKVCGALFLDQIS